MMKTRSCIDIKKEWDIVGARQMGRRTAKEIGFGTVEQARIATAISELAINIYLYSEKGTICLEFIIKDGEKGIQIIANDQGPGIKDVHKVLEDGFTTSGGLGAGLPGVKRLMAEFTITSDDRKGTKVIAIKWLQDFRN